MHLPSPGHQVMPLYLIETVNRDWLYLSPLETVTEEGEPETVTEEGEPETVTEEGEPETVTEEGEPETVTEEGEPETVTEEGEPARDERHILLLECFRCLIHNISCPTSHSSGMIYVT